MFGFLQIKKCRLTSEQSQLYNAHFCSGCHALRAFGGLGLSLLTNYDQTFLVLVTSAFDRPDAATERRPCTAVPFRRVGVQPMSERASTAVAALTVALVDAKLRDDIVDEGRWTKRGIARLLRPHAVKACHALDAFGFRSEALEHLGARQAAAEADPRPTFEALSAPTSDCMGDVFAFVGTLTGHEQRTPVLRGVGASLGRFIYLWDALTDLEEDQRSGSFNAILACCGRDWSKTSAREMLDDQLNAFERALSLLPLGPRRPIATALVASMRSRLNARLPVARSRPAFPLRRVAQAGFCDCGGVDCCGASCCGGTDCGGADCCAGHACGCEHCGCHGGHLCGATDGSAGCEGCAKCCECCDCGCDCPGSEDCCTGWSKKKKKTRKKGSRDAEAAEEEQRNSDRQGR